MSNSALFTFDSSDDRDKFLNALRHIAISEHEHGELVGQALDCLNLEPNLTPLHKRQVTLFVSGERMGDGPLDEMHKAFDQELTKHSASVELREWKSNKWRTVRRRHRQR